MPHFPQHSSENLPVVIHSLKGFLSVSENWIYPQVTALQRHQAHVLTNHRLNEDQYPFPQDRIHVIPPLHGRLTDSLSFHLRTGRDTATFQAQALQPCRPQLLHSHFGWRGWSDLRLRDKLQLPQIVTFYGRDISASAQVRKWRRRYKSLFQQATLFMVEGCHMKTTLQALGCPSEKIRIRRHGVDLGKIPFCARKSDGDGLMKILVAARFTEKKGIADALKAVEQISDKYPNIALTVIGDADDKDTADQVIKKEIMALMHSARLRERCNWLGLVPHAEFMKIALQHHIFIQASCHAADGNSEGGAPVSLIQLAATGMPILATRHCDIPEVVLDLETGFLADEKDIDGLATGLDRLLSEPDKWPGMGQKARNHIQSRYDHKRTIRDLESIYDEALASV